MKNICENNKNYITDKLFIYNNKLYYDKDNNYIKINNSNWHKYLKDYIKAGSDTLIIHYEASHDIKKDLTYIRDNNVRAGIALNPDTNPRELTKYIDFIDYILIMSVYPGFGCQSFIKESIDTMLYLKKLTKNNNILIGVDGGVNLNTIDSVYDKGIDIVIVGSGLYGAENIKKRYLSLINEK